MADIENLVKQAVGELDRLLHARNVVGDPVVHGDVTVVPLVSFGFGFGAGGGADTQRGGEGGATGGGGGIKPVAALVIDKDGARIEPVKTAGSTLADALAVLAGKLGEGAVKGRKRESPAE